LANDRCYTYASEHYLNNVAEFIKENEIEAKRLRKLYYLK
jgi:hypothetical protein